MSNFAFQRTAVDEAGNIIPDAEVEVRDQDGVLAALFDESGASLLNPLSADAEGFFRFYVAIGQYDITVRGNGRELTWIDVQIGVPDDRPLLRAPEITSPQDLALDVAINFELEGSPYASLYEADLRQYRQFQVTPLSGELSNPVFDVQQNTNTAEIGPILPNTQYQARIRDVSINGDQSPWSPVISFTSTGVFVVTPTNVAPIDGATNESLTPTLESSAFQTEGAADVHESSRWRVFDNGGVLVYDSGNVTSALTSFELPQELDKNTTYTWQVRHIGQSLGASQYSDPTSFTTTNAEIQTPTITVEGSPDGVPESPAVTGSAFTMTQGTETHESTDWRVREAATGAVVYESLGDAVNLESIQVPGGVLDELTEYDFEARYNGALVSSDYGVATATTLAEFPVLPPFLAAACVLSPFAGVYNQKIDSFEYLQNLNTDATDDGTAIAFNSDDSRLVFAFSSGNLIESYSRSNGVFSPMPSAFDSFPSTGFSNRANKLAFSPDGSTLFFCGTSQDAKVYSVTASGFQSTSTTLGKCTDISFSANGYAVTSSGSSYNGGNNYNAILYSYSQSNFTQIQYLYGPTTNTNVCAISSDAKYITVSDNNAELFAFQKDISDNITSVTIPQLPDGFGYTPRALKFIRGDSILLALTASEGVYAYSVSNGSFSLLQNYFDFPDTGTAFGAGSLSVSSDEKYIAIASRDSQPKVFKYNGSGYSLLPPLPGNLSLVTAVAFSNTGYPQL